MIINLNILNLLKNNCVINKNIPSKVIKFILKIYNNNNHNHKKKIIKIFISIQLKLKKSLGTNFKLMLSINMNEIIYKYFNNKN